MTPKQGDCTRLKAWKITTISQAEVRGPSFVTRLSSFVSSSFLRSSINDDSLYYLVSCGGPRIPPAWCFEDTQNSRSSPLPGICFAKRQHYGGAASRLTSSLALVEGARRPERRAEHLANASRQQQLHSVEGPLATHRKYLSS